MKNKKIKILAIDDTSDNLVILKLMIKDAFPEAKIFTALDGKSGLELAAAENPDVILLDIVMPDMDGFEVCQTLKADKTLSDIPIIIVTSFKRDKKNCLRALDAGAEAFLARPIEPIELFAQIRTMVKIKNTNIEKREEGEKLNKMVEEQTRNLTSTHTATLNLLEDIKNENEARKKSEEDLKESEQKYRSLVEGSPDAIAIYSKGKIVFANHSSVSLMKASSVDDLIGRSVIDFVHPNSRELVGKRMMEAMTMGNALPTAEEKFVRLDDSVVDVEVKAMPVIYDKENAVQITVRDITIRKQTEEALKMSEERFRSVWENSVDGMRICNNEGTIVAVNNAYCKLVEAKKEAIEGQSFNIVYLSSDEENQTAIQHYKDRFSTRTFVPKMESELMLRSGKMLSVEMSNAFLESNGNDQLLLSIFRDITERKHADVLLRESEGRYRNLYNSTPLMFFTIDSNGIVLSVNKYGANYLGYSQEELLGGSVLKVFPPDQQSAAQAQVKQCLENIGMERTWEIRKVRKDGTILWVSEKARAVSSDGTVSIFITCEDITERKKAQEILLMSEEKYRLIVDSASDIIYTTNREGYLLYANPVGLKIFCDPEKELHSYHYLDFVVPEQREQVKKSFYRQFLSGKQNSSFEIKTVTKDGKHIWLDQNVQLLKKGEEIVGFHAISRDITDRKIAEERIELLKNTIDVSSDGVYWMDVEGRFIYANESGCKMLGYSQDELLNIRIFDVNPRVTPQRWVELWQGIRGEKYFISESIHRRKDGSEFPVEIVSTYINYGDKEYINGFARDITERKQVEEALRESELQFRSVTESANDAIVTADVNGIILQWNPAAKKIFGYTETEVIGTTLDKIVPNRYLDQHLHGLNRMKHGGGRHIIGKTIELHGLHKSGKEFPLELSLAEWETTSGKYYTGIIRDITERKNAASQLTLLAHALTSIGECVSITDLNDTIVFVNSAFCTTYGYNIDEILGKHISMLRSPDSDSVAVSEILEQTKQGRWRGELLNRRKNGEIFFIDLSTSAIRNEQGENIALIGVAQDITERKKSEEQQSLLRIAFESAANGIVVTDIEGTIVWVNNAFTKITGYTLDEAVSSNPRILKSGKQSDSFYKKLWETIKSGNVWKGEFINKRKDGSLYTDEMTITPVRDAHNAITHFVGIKQDVTERNKSFEQIAQQALLLDKAHDAIIVRDMNHRIQFWNKGAERMYGWSADEVLGKDAREILFNDKTKYAELYTELIKTGLYEGEVIHYSKDKKEITVDVRLSVIQDTIGNPKSILSINTDITDKKKIEMQFMRSQRMESIGTLAGGIAHDLNNILGPILLSVQILRMKERDETLQNLINTIESSTLRGKSIIAQVLGFARGTGSTPVLMQVRHIVKEVEDVIKQTFEKNITIQSHVPKDLWTINADPTQVQQLVMNLCVNARDAMPNGGHLSINVHNVEVDELFQTRHPDANEERYLEIEVRDTGTGIPLNIQQKIFDPFFTTKEIGKGTGLGLSTVYNIVKAHRGFLTMDSTAETGTSFHIYIPASKESGVISDVSDKTTIPQGKGETILVVDDERSIRSVCEEIFQFYNYNIVTADNGAEGISTFIQNKEKVKVVLIDIMMPKMDGKIASAEIRKIDPSIKIIGMSGLTSESTIDSSNKLFDQFLHKPFSGRELIEAIQKVIV